MASAESPPSPLSEQPNLTPIDTTEKIIKATDPDTTMIDHCTSFKEEPNNVEDLTDPERKALDELKALLSSAIAAGEFRKPPPPAVEDKPKKLKDCLEADKVTDDARTVEAIEETVKTVELPTDHVFLWGVPVGGGDERTHTVLLKFLRAREFRARDAIAMIKSTVAWREEFGIEALVDEDLGLAELEKAVYVRGADREGHPVCYNVFGEFREREVYGKVFGDEEKRRRFLRWRVKVLEKEIRDRLDFGSRGVHSFVQVVDLKNSNYLYKKEFRVAYKHALHVLQDNYPEFVAKQVYINVPWWYLAFARMMSPFMTQRTKSKFVFAGPSRSAETLFKYIAPEQVPVQYGGLDKENDPEFSTADAVTEVTVKPSSKQIIEIPVSAACEVVWELRVLGWDVSYGSEFVPDTEGHYTLIIQKLRRFCPSDDIVEKKSFKIDETGKIVLVIDNTTSKKKKLLYRFKIKCSAEST